MSSTSNLKLDFVVFPGDPESDAEAIPSQRVVDEFEELKERLRFDEEVYGAVVLSRNGKPLSSLESDPILKLITKITRSLPYVVEGEPETVLFTESDHGFVFEPVNDDVLISFFKGVDAFDPEEFLIEQESMPIAEFGEQVVQMADRLLKVLRKWNPQLAEHDDYGKSLVEFLEPAKTAVKTYRLEKEHGLRR